MLLWRVNFIYLLVLNCHRCKLFTIEDSLQTDFVSVEQECPSALDLAFMVDVSGSIHVDDLKSTKKMLQKVTAGFILSSSGTLCSHDESMRVKRG